MKYLITSVYQYYDEYNISNVCVCDTKERAEQLVKDFNASKENFKLIQGYKLYLSKYNEEQLKHFHGFHKIETTDFYITFINSDNFEHYKEYLIRGNYIIEKISYFGFKCNFSGVQTETDIESKFCNHPNATLEIHEIPSM